MTSRFRKTDVEGIEIFYREAGNPAAPAVLLLHGFPTSSHMFRNVIPALADRWHVIAPDLPGFGFSGSPDQNSFARLAELIERFTEQVGLSHFAMLVFDYGAPVGFRLALRHPERIAAIISQNGNAYQEGLSEGWNPIQAYWREPSASNRQALNGFLQPASTRWQYTHGADDETAVAPETYTLDQALLDRPGNMEVQLDLFLDYQTNISLYPAFQQYFRDNQPPLLAVWGKHDPFFTPPGAEAFRRDMPHAEVHLLDAGHFAIETQAETIIALLRDFLGRVHVHDPASKTVQTFYSALGRGDVATVVGLLAPELSWTEAETFPYYSGTWTTPEQVRKGLLVPASQDWKDFSAVPDRLIVDGATVVALGAYSGVNRESGKKLAAPFAHIWEVHAGRITRFIQYTDTALVREAL